MSLKLAETQHAQSKLLCFPSPPCLQTYRVSIDLVLVEIWALKVVEVGKDVLVLVLVVSGLQLEDGRDELGETEQLGYDGVPSAHQLQDGLAAVIVRREKVLRHGEPCQVECSHGKK